MTRNLGFKAVGLLCFAAAGCADALAVNARGATVDAPEIAAPSPTPTCEVTTPDPSSAVIACRDANSPGEPTVPVPEAPPPVAARPTLSFTAPPAPVHAEQAADDALAPDPFAGARREFELRASGPLTDDDLAPDPFAKPRRETRLPAKRPLADDDLAPDPFARRRHEARLPAGKPLAADDLAPAPF